MPSAFPGIDPFVESQAWETFHVSLIAEIVAVLAPRVAPAYIVRAEERVYLEHLTDGGSAHIRPDVALLETGSAPAHGHGSTAVAPAPIEVTLPMPERVRQTYLTVRRRGSMEVVTVIEVLSPANKRGGSDGRREYLAKRNEVLSSPTGLVELDLLRGGERLPVVGPLPPADYLALASPQRLRPRAHLYAWTLRQALPPIGVPLGPDDPDVQLDLQAIYAAAYDRAGFGYSIDHAAPVDPPLADADAAWVRTVLAS